MKRFFLLVFIPLVFLSSKGNGQPSCGMEIRQQQALLRNPALAEDRRQLEQLTKAWIAKQALEKTRENVVRLPVVVHVVWRTQEQNISDEQIRSQIAILNRDFRKMNPDAGTTPTPFAALVADVGIEFCLAAKDPAGMATTGITRTKTTVTDIGDKDRWFSTLRGGKDPWNTKKYINIWVCEAGDDLFGFAFLPGTADPPEADGLVISSQYFGSTGTALASRPNHKGRTTTHEMGHYFNLDHLWGPDDSTCDEGDNVADTPPQYEATYECPGFPLRDRCTPGGSGILFFNYMDYTDDECMYMFTLGQKQRMLAALNGPRSNLLGQSNCSLSTSVSSQAEAQAPQIFPNPASGWIRVLTQEGESRPVKLELYDYHGRKLQEKVSHGECNFDVSGCAPGVYWIRLAENGRVYRCILAP